MKILYTGAFRFPDGDAASQRVLSNAKIFRELGHEVIFAGWEKKSVEISSYQGFLSFSQSELDIITTNPFVKLRNFIFRGANTLVWLKNYLRKNSLDIIIVYNSNVYFIYCLMLLGKKNNIKIICDCTEWYEGEHLPGGKYGIANLDNNLRVKLIYPLIKNVIVISSYLENYLNNKGANTILIPPLVDLEDKKWSIWDSKIKFSKECIELIYAGDPGKKDLILIIIEALNRINKDCVRIRFNILGITKENLTTIIGKEHYYDFINCFGRVELNDVPKYYQLSHFSVLIREKKRYAESGFSTKFVESLACGIPVIANVTSDIPDYISNGLNGFLIYDDHIDEIEMVFRNLLTIDNNKYEEMVLEAIKTSKKSFNYNCYLKNVNQYLNNL